MWADIPQTAVTESETPNGAVVDIPATDNAAPLPEAAPKFSYEPTIPPAVPSPMPAPAERSVAASVVRDPKVVLQDRLAELNAGIKRDGSGDIVSLDFTGTKVTDEDLNELTLCENLKILSLRNTEITDEGLRLVGLSTNVQLLILSGTNISDAGIDHLWTLGKLRFVALDNTAVTNAALEKIRRFEALEGVSVMETGITASAIEEFKQQRPGCRVITNEEEIAKPPMPPKESARIRSLPATQQVVNTQPHNTARTAATTQRPLRDVLQSRLRDPELLLAMGEEMLAEKRYGDAANVLFTALLRSPDDVMIQYNLGVALAYSGQCELAFPYLERSVGAAAAYHDLAVVCLEAGKPFQAEAYFSRAISHDPTLAESSRWLAMLRARSAESPVRLPVRQLSEAELLGLLHGNLASPVGHENSGVTIIPAGGVR
ncbi:MAG: hypothetical protein KDA66_06690 [Planctomycetaceae bacterium]|nr:hypothetical protein [Planctomycetaceae bacterium]